MNLKTTVYTIQNLNKINILLGKNGAGKSTILKGLLSATDDGDQPIHTEYITPERGGFLRFESGVDSSINSNPKWVVDTRKVNQTGNFKEQTVSRYQVLQLKVLTALSEKLRQDFNGGVAPNEESYTFFERNIDSINSLLDNIEIKMDGEKGFKIYKKHTQDIIPPHQISSGESELIALAIECLYFQKSNNTGIPKVLLLDEPDVHLHPDLQVKFMRFIHTLATEQNAEFTVLIATHSTAFLGAIEDKTDVNISFIGANQTTIDFTPITDIYTQFLPVFGAHPLSNVFNEAPILLVEGEDDERIWQQAVRSAQGAIKLYPCVCGDNSKIGLFEWEVKRVIKSIYDNAKAYSLRDRDNTAEADLPDDGPIIKHKLRCYSAENLLLTDEVLSSLGFTWSQLVTAMDEWILEKGGKSHPQLEDMIAFKASSYDRKNIKIKSLRMLLMGIMGSDKPWEVIVGQTIANLSWNTATDYTLEGSIYNYLGKKIVEGIIPQV